MRNSSRNRILKAASAAGRSGIPAITLEGAAQEAGLTKGGVIYHFRTKRELLEAAVDYISETWEKAMLAALSCAFDEADEQQRTRAYLAVAADPAFTRGDFLACFNSPEGPEVTRSWTAMIARWFGTGDPDAVSRRLKVIRLAADGLWLAKTTGALADGDGDEYRVLVKAIGELLEDEGR